jgi:DeoR/GlpR family transcriptional regulator of sugar metabolism
MQISPRKDDRMSKEREKQILEILWKEKKVTVGQLARVLYVSEPSVRRDLQSLEGQNLIKRTHGGAMAMKAVAYGKPAGVTCADFGEIRPNYLAIAEQALSMLSDHDVIFITAATVGYFMAQRLPETLSLRVVTNSTVMAEELRKKPNVSVIMLGGEMDAKGNCYDAFAIEMIKQLRFDKCFLTSAAISPDFGLSIQKSGAIPFWNAVIDASRQAIGLYPTEKIGSDSIVRICPANRLNTLITDDEISDTDLAAFEEQGIDVIVTVPQNDSLASDTENAESENNP